MLFTLGSILYSLHSPSPIVTKASLILFEVFVFFVLFVITSFWGLVGVNGISYSYCSQQIGDTCISYASYKVLDKASLELFFRIIQELLTGVIGWGWLMWNAIVYSVKQLTKVGG